MTPVMDEAKRTYTHIIHTIDATGYVTSGGGGGTIDSTLDSMHTELMTPGQVLTLNGKGFGDLVADGSPVDDVIFGPFPKLLAWNPVGSNKAALVHWVCEVNVPVCLQSVKYKKALMACNYEMTYSLDDAGYTNLTYSGYLEIPMSRDPFTSTVPDTADAYRDQIVSNTLPGFARKSQTYEL